MREPESGEMIFCDYGGNYLPAPAIVTAVNPSDYEGEFLVHATVFSRGRNPVDISGTLYSSEEKAREANSPPSKYAFWRKPDPRDRLIDSLISALAEYQGTI
jgi:hypothetical protein